MLRRNIPTYFVVNSTPATKYTLVLAATSPEGFEIFGGREVLFLNYQKLTV